MLIVPPSADKFFERVQFHDREAALEEIRADIGLVLCKVPGVFYPDIYCSFQGLLAPLSHCRGLCFTFHICVIHKKEQDRELITDDRYVYELLMNDLEAVTSYPTPD